MQTTLAVLCSLSEVRMLMVGEPSLPIRPAMSAPRPLVTGAMKQLRIMGLLCRRSKVVNIPIQFKTQNKTRGQTFTTLRFRSHTATMCNVTLITSPWFVGSTKAHPADSKPANLRYAAKAAAESSITRDESDRLSNRKSVTSVYSPRSNAARQALRCTLPLVVFFMAPELATTTA